MPDIAADGVDFKVRELPDLRIEGHARMAFEAGKPMDEAYFNVPFISHVKDNLWQGGHRHTRLPDDFKYVVSLYPWERYEVGPDTELVEFTMYDSGDRINETDLFEAANLLRSFYKRGKTLVHCQAGLNRSALVAATALILDGMKPQDAVDLLRKRSPLVLCNSTFERWLLSGSDEWVDRLGG